jgi:hypothetical protein
MRVNYVKKAKKDQGTCTCGHEIKAGEAYKWAKGRYGPRMVRCEKCSFRQSDLTSSDKLSRVYGAQEDAEDRLQGWDGEDAEEARSLLQELGEAVREVGEEYQESADNIRESFSESSTADECEEKAEQLEDWASTCESAADDIEDFDEDTVEPEADESKEDAVERARGEWADEVRNTVEGAIGECPV